MVLDSSTNATVFINFYRVRNKMGEVRVNLTNFITIGLMAFLAVIVINKGLQYSGKPQWKIGA